MKILRSVFTIFLFTLFLGGTLAPEALHAEDRAHRTLKKFDADNDGRISRDEWTKSAKKFIKKDRNNDGFLSLGELGKKGKNNNPQRLAAANQKKTGLPPGFPQPYFVDAHSQMARGLDPESIIPQMDKAGVWRTILSARNDRKPKDVMVLVKQHPDRLTAAVRSKGGFFNRNDPKFKKQINKQIQNPVFAAMAEILYFHAQKGNKAPEINVSITSPQSQMLINISRKRGWPVIAHYEFAASSGSLNQHKKEFKQTLRDNPDMAFLLIHMGQLGVEETRQFIETYKNIYFLTSHANPITAAQSNQPWSNLFVGDELAPSWKALMIQYPERFVLAFDNVFPEHWEETYIEQAQLWRKVLNELPENVGAAIAHGNAEKLWKLPKP